MVILIALDQLYVHLCMVPIFFDLSAFLVQKKKNTIFDPIKVALFSEQCGLILVYSGSSRRELQESHPMPHGISYTQNVSPL
jgi:hypothetical protein